ELVDRHGAEFTKVKELQERIQAVYDRSREARNQYDSQDTKELLVSLKAGVGALRQLQAEIARNVQADSAGVNRNEALILTNARLRHAVEHQRQLLNTVTDQMSQAKFTGNYSRIGSQVLQPAMALPHPVRPRAKLALFLAGLTGCVLSLGGVFAKH